MSDELLRKVAEAYQGTSYANEFAVEESILKKLLPLLQEKLAPITLESPLGVGSTALVLRCREPRLEQDRALKLPRPRLSQLSKIIRVLRGESETLATLNHHNVVKVHLLGEVALQESGEDYSFPYFLMDCLDGVKDFDKYILAHPDTPPVRVIEWLRDAASGVAYLHSKQVIHCDIKPGNILLAESSGALITDLGYAKHFPRPGGGDTTVTYTPEWAHPELHSRMQHATDDAANVATISREDLRTSFDLYSLGRTFRHVLSQLRAQEKRGERAFSLTGLQWQYLTLIRMRLQDGQVKISDRADPLNGDLFPGLTARSMGEISYTSAEQAVEDFDKLLSLYDLEAEIPELKPHLRSYIQVPGARVPATRRVLAVINHPTFARLRHTTQLGFVSLVYPGAIHSRFEHSLGVFTEACGLMRGLWYDPANCLFRSLFHRTQLEAGLVAALVHDIGQYSMAHDMTEISVQFEHENFTESALFYSGFDDVPSLMEVIQEEWGVTPEALLGVLKANSQSTLHNRILHSVLSGPLDADKLDYLVRDSLHLGVTFGDVIDRERLTRNITTCVKIDLDRFDNERQSVAEIGVTDRALAVADSVWRARLDMFRQVYWQHTVRSLKVMLAFVVRRIVANLEDHPDDRARFWQDFQGIVLSPQGVAFNYYRASQEPSPPSGSQPENVYSSDRKSMEWPSALSAGDDAILQLLSKYTDTIGSDVLVMIKRRMLFKRYRVVSWSVERDAFEDVYGRFRAYLQADDQKSLEEVRLSEERKLRQELEARGLDCSGIEPLLLLDVTLKAPRRSHSEEVLWYLEEHGDAGLEGTFESLKPVKSTINIERGLFDRQAGKVRWFIHPAVHEWLKTSVAQ